MNYKYIIIGIDIIFASTAAIAIALYNGYESLLGVGFSLLVLGVIISGIGLTSVEPLDRFFRDITELNTKIIGKVLEDTGLLYAPGVRTCLNGADSVVIHGGGVGCGSVRPGLGVYEGRVYLAIPLSAVPPTNVAEALDSENIPALDELLRDALLRTYALGRDVTVTRSGREIKVALHDLRPEVIGLIKSPLNPLKIVLASLVSKVLRREVIVVSDDVLGEDYVIEMRVL